jgi:hypothetical protein
MQRMTTMPTRHWRGSGALLVAAIVALLVLLFLLVMNNVSTTPQSTPVAPALPTTSTRPYNRFFADEANYAPTLEEYLNPSMSDTYMPITPRATVPEAVVVPAPISRPWVRWQNRFFADEAIYRPTVEEYLNPYMTDTYLPITPPEAVQPATQEVNRFFADEMAGAGQAPIIIDLVTSPPERATPQFGPS